MIPPSKEQEKYLITPLLAQEPERVQQYFQTLVVHDTLKYRLCGVKEPQWGDVLHMIQERGKQMYLVTSEQRPHEILAEFMLECFTGESAQIHISFSPSKVTLPEKLRINKQVVKALFEDWVNPETSKPFLQSIFGLISVTNRPSILVALKSGFKKVGILQGGIKYPDKVEDAAIMVLNNGR